VQSGDGLWLDGDGRLQVMGRDAPALARVIAAACRPTPDAAAGTAVLQAERRSGGSFAVLVSPLRAVRGAQSPAGAPVAGVPVSAHDRRREATGRLRRLYGLTAAQARLTQAIVPGRTLSEAADALGTTRNPARWTLKQVFAKSGTRRQVELARLILTG